MADEPPRHALIVGAGLAGSLMACYLARAGWRVSVYERRSDPRKAGYAGGRSINLALSARGLAGLRGVGLDEIVLSKDAIPMRGRMIHRLAEATKRRSDEAAKGAGGTSNIEHRTSNLEVGGFASSRAVGANDAERHAALPSSDPSSLRRSVAPSLSDTIFQPYSKDPADAINSVSREGLNLTLLEAADAHENVSLHFEHACVDVDLDAPAAIFEMPAGSASRVEANLVIGADGAFSAVRAKMQKLDRFDYSQSYLEHGYKELHIPPGANGGFAMEPHALHIWPRGSSMMIALPNRDGSFTCTLFWPFEGPHSFANLKTPEDVLALFREQYPDAEPLMPTLVEDYFGNPTSSLVTVRCWPWQHGGKVVLIGDAAHAIVPFYGQGMNAAFEDCLVLAECMEEATKRRSDGVTKGLESEGDSASGPSSLRRFVAPSLSDERQLAALTRYQSLRKPDADAIADMAIENFVEMRDKVGDPAFLYKKRVEQAVHALFPDRVTPQYNLVSFSNVPYTEARRRGRELDAILERIIARVPRDASMSMSDEQWQAEIQRLAREQLGCP